MRKLFAFTLAEVLLTMTIVGVVAAMTIPTLSYQKTKKEYSVKLKNFYSRMENSILDMQMDYGSFRDLKKPVNCKGYDWYMKYIDPYMGHQYVDSTNKIVYYKDGSSLGTFFTGGCLEVYYDVNGDKAPNKVAFDKFVFWYCFDDANRNYYFGNKDVFFGVYGYGVSSLGVSRESMISKCKTSPLYCTRILQNDQWEFKSDYPFKF